MTTPSFDLAAAHRYFAAHCFNATWGLLDKPDRSAVDEEAMVATAFASLWHWSRRPDVTSDNLSIGLWQVARVFAVVGQAENAGRYAARCVAISEPLGPFLRGYAYEASARAAMAAGDRSSTGRWLTLASAEASRIEDAEHRAMLEADLAAIAAAP